jgi:hypothetical protein
MKPRLALTTAWRRPEGHARPVPKQPSRQSKPSSQSARSPRRSRCWPARPSRGKALSVYADRNWQVRSPARLRRSRKREVGSLARKPARRTAVERPSGLVASARAKPIAQDPILGCAIVQESLTTLPTGLAEASTFARGSMPPAWAPLRSTLTTFATLTTLRSKST